MTRCFGAFALLFILPACGPQLKDQIQGTWQAIGINEEGQPLDVDISTIRLTFGPGDAYQYNGNLNYKESGNFTIHQKYLYTTDTIHPGTKKKVVEIASVSNDTLRLNMKEAGKERFFILKKVN